ncbi:UDP-4-amino-4-deoxy-L-arabinose--oxoglutarate aminotransferase [uncultured archaeon]|nr:UDP-4-amino-4-deoxy-L-arabinose--oxoglutarate aminotransferase [uncultured archaeon]
MSDAPASQEQALRQEILDKVKQYYQLKHAKRPFEPGKTYIGYAGRVFDETEMMALADSGLDFWLTAGRFSALFESSFAKWYGRRSCYLVNSGSSANLLALSALGAKTLGARRLQAGDEVITTSTSFPTTVNPIFQNGAVPVFIDTEVGTYNMDVSRLEEAVSDKTRAVMVAHTLGYPFNLDAVTAFCKKHNLWLIEDCCDAVGATWNGQKVGTFGDMATVSFYPAHHMTMGEGGAVLASSPLLGRALESYRDWGRDCWCAPGKDNTCGKRFNWQLGDLPHGYDHKYIYSNIGYNLKLTDMQAAVGVAQLAKLDSFIKARQDNYFHLLKSLSDYEPYLILPQQHPKAVPSPFGFALTVRDDAPFSRKQIVDFLESRKIATRMVFCGNIVRQPAYKGTHYRQIGELSGSDKIMRDTFWIGVYPGITAQVRDYIVEQFAAFLREKPGWKKN